MGPGGRDVSGGAVAAAAGPTAAAGKPAGHAHGHAARRVRHARGQEQRVSGRTGDGHSRHGPDGRPPAQHNRSNVGGRAARAAAAGAWRRRGAPATGGTDSQPPGRGAPRPRRRPHARGAHRARRRGGAGQRRVSGWLPPASPTPKTHGGGANGGSGGARHAARSPAPPAPSSADQRLLTAERATATPPSPSSVPAPSPTHRHDERPPRGRVHDRLRARL